ncbi:mg356 protein [Tupanvirus deep ocean]|uniref:Mg356 protein n=2 Tax=Tupanvirus TaxID=2094720 RepID=A0AC62A9B0_9VIRU|nr:mg356 protein [Tupanvirus deep ocean]QKU34263.1 mg356 protein [Tupanvirus deep ocean]
MSITTIVGPMFSGKTTELIRLIDRQRIAGKKCLIIKHSMDDRFDDVVSTTNKGTGIYHVTTHSEICYYKCDIKYLSDVNDIRVFNFIKEKYDVVGVEEGFFFKGIHNFCNMLADNGIVVIISTLDTSFKQEIFPEIGDLMGSSEKLIKLTAVCMRCRSNEKRDASFTIRTIDSDEAILVGGSDIYQSVCRECLNEFIKNKTKEKQIESNKSELCQIDETQNYLCDI